MSSLFQWLCRRAFEVTSKLFSSRYCGNIVVVNRQRRHARLFAIVVTLFCYYQSGAMAHAERLQVLKISTTGYFISEIQGDLIKLFCYKFTVSVACQIVL